MHTPFQIKSLKNIVLALPMHVRNKMNIKCKNMKEIQICMKKKKKKKKNIIIIKKLVYSNPYK